MSIGMLLSLPPREAIYSAFFHTISAFCNAGFSIYTDSLTGFAANPVVMASSMVLIVLGGAWFIWFSLICIPLYIISQGRRVGGQGFVSRFTLVSCCWEVLCW
jgi:Trk-type K+ transport system membrane component